MIALLERPFPIDFAKNHPGFVFRTTDPYNVQGRYETATFAVFSIPYVNGFDNTLVLTTPYGTIIRHIDAPNSSHASPRWIRSSQSVEIIEEELLNRLFNVSEIIDYYKIETWIDLTTYQWPACMVRITEKVMRTQTTRVSLTYQQDGMIQSVVDGNPPFYSHSYAVGRDEEKHTGYTVHCKFLIEKYSDNRDAYIATSETIERIESPEFNIFENDMKTRVGTDLLRSYFDMMDIPPYNEQFGAYPLLRNSLAFRIKYESRFDGQTDSYSYTSSKHILLNAELPANKFITNQADWDVGGYNGQLSQCDFLINWGTPRGGRFRTYIDSQQYVYIANWGAINRYLDMTIAYKTIGGNSYMIQQPQLTIPPQSICRIPIGAKCIIPTNHVADTYTYTVHIKEADRVISHLTFEVVEKPYFAKEFLLQNKLGIAEPFWVEHVSLDVKMDGSNVTIAGNSEIDITSIGKEYTLYTGYKTKREMRLLATALGNKDNFILNNEFAYRISFIPSSTKIIDEGNDLQSAEIKFIVNKPINRIVAQPLADELVMDENVVISDNNVINDFINSVR